MHLPFQVNAHPCPNSLSPPRLPSMQSIPALLHFLLAETNCLSHQPAPSTSERFCKTNYTANLEARNFPRNAHSIWVVLLSGISVNMPQGWGAYQGGGNWSLGSGGTWGPGVAPAWRVRVGEGTGSAITTNRGGGLPRGSMALQGGREGTSHDTSHSVGMGAEVNKH